MMHQYVPPEFELYEFDGGSLPPDQPERRTFHTWNGAVNESAEEVSLAWWAGPAAAFVSTSGRPDEARWARLSAAHLALAGDNLLIPSRPGTTGEVAQEIRRIASSAELWTPGPALVPGGPPADVAVCDGFCLAYSQLGAEMVLVAAVGVGADQLTVRKVRNWSDYDDLNTNQGCR
ncbi:MAG: hypothetical protein ACRDOI_04415 [Trebonia sp.]